MDYSIKVGDKYLESIDVDSGYLGHSPLNINSPKQLILSDNPILFTSRAIHSKILLVIELMRYGDIKQEEIKITPHHT